MVKNSPCTPPTPRNRRSARWADYKIDRSEVPAREPIVEAWPEMSAHAPRPANDDSPPVEQHTSQAELADRLGVCVATLARQRNKGRLFGRLIGGQWRFSEQQIADYLKLTEKPLCLYGKRLNDNDPSRGA